MITFLGFGQNHEIQMNIRLIENKDLLQIQQQTRFFNSSKDTLSELYFHNWNNSYRSNKAPLSQRLVDDYDKSLYFAKDKDRGYTKIENITIGVEQLEFKEFSDQSDILKVVLKEPLIPGNTVEINISYEIKIPNAKFTRYGKTKTGYHLRYWYLIPARYTDRWLLMSNLNMDDLISFPTDYKININLPHKYFLQSNLYKYTTKKEDYNSFFMIGKQKNDIILSINTEDLYNSYKTSDLQIFTDIKGKGVTASVKQTILDRQLAFIRQYLGKYPHKEILLDEASHNKNPIYGLNQLPRFIRPFPDVFEWDLTILKALTKKYIESTILMNTREDYWLTDGLQTYLMMEYVSKNYPEIRLAGNISKIWGLRNFNFSKLAFNDKYPFVYQFSARQLLDQSLNTPSDSLSNFNRKVISKYKAGLGIRYLADFVGDSIVKSSFKEFYLKNVNRFSSSTSFQNIITSKTDKNIDWFFGDYIQTNKRIDYTIKNAEIENDSVVIVIKNKRNTAAPVALYGVKDKEIKFKKWLTDIKGTKEVRIPKSDFDRVALNYENSYPEFNSLDNWRKIGKNLLSKPVKFKLYKDVNDPYYHQLFLQPNIKYNFYDGVLLGLRIHNKPILVRNFQFSVTPMYGTKNGSLNGTFGTSYTQFFENAQVERIIYSLSGSNLHYAEDLSYNSFNQAVTVVFQRKSLRDVERSFLQARLLNINRELLPGANRTDSDRYSILKLRYFYNNPSRIKEFQYAVDAEIGSSFTKTTGEIRFRKLTDTNRQLDFRAFAGVFLRNDTDTDFFSFGVDRANDYLFELNYLGRSESSGLFSQQFFLAEGGFRSQLSQRFANQFLVSLNSSVGLWRWLEFYNNIAFIKNKNRNMLFGYENGIRLNFIDTIFELHFPLFNNSGWLVNQQAYSNNIRFVIQLQPRAIFNFFRRGFL